MAARIEIVGVYPVVGAEEPVSLIELWIRDYAGKADFGVFGQQVPELQAANDQVAYDEHVLNDAGTSG